MDKKEAEDMLADVAPLARALVELSKMIKRVNDAEKEVKK